MKLCLTLAIGVLILASVGCGLLGENKDPKTPDGAWNLFIDHMKNKNWDAAWDMLSDDSKKDFEYIYSLVTTLFAKLPPDDKKEMEDIFRQEIGDVQITNPKDLLRAEFGDIDEQTLAGSKIDSKVVQGDKCTITTKAAQTFEMIKKGDTWCLNYTSIKGARKDFETALNNYGIPLPPEPGVTPTTPTAPATTAGPATPTTAPRAPTLPTKPTAGPKSPTPKPPPPIKAGKR